MTHDEKERLLIQFLPGIRMEACKVARRFGLDYGDCIQEACLAAWKSLELFDPSLGFGVWTYMERWVAFSLLSLCGKRRRQRDREAVLDHDVSDHRRDWSPQEFEDLISPCHYQDRDVLRAMYVQGLTQEEIGRERGVTHQRIAQYHRRALTKIRAKEKRRELLPAKEVRP
jgi:RNA polymerase sigma factor (sigma-70 family)